MQTGRWNRLIRNGTNKVISVKIRILGYNTYVLTRTTYGGVQVSTGVWNKDKRVAVCSVCVKKGTLNINAKNTNSYALAA